MSPRLGMAWISAAVVISLAAGCQTTGRALESVRIAEAKMRFGYDKEDGVQIFINQAEAAPESVLQGETLTAEVEYLVAGTKDTNVNVTETWVILEEGEPISDTSELVHEDRGQSFYSATNRFVVPSQLPPGTYLMEFRVYVKGLPGAEARETMRFTVVEPASSL